MTIGNIKAVCVHVQISIKTNQPNADHMILALTVNRLYTISWKINANME